MKATWSSSDSAEAKLELLRTGVVLPPLLASVPFLDVIFPKGVWASLTQSDFNTSGAQFELIQEQEFSYLIHDTKRVHVEVRSNPDFYNNRTATGKAFGEIAGIRANYVEILPEAVSKGSQVTPGEILEVVRRSLEGGWAEYVGFYDDSGPGEESFARIEPQIAAIKRHLDTHVSLTTQPPCNAQTIDRAYGAGVDAVAYITDNMACGDELGKTDYFRMLTRAAHVFSPGSVATTLLLDRRRQAELPKIINCLTSQGIFPMLAYRMSFGDRVQDPIAVPAAIELFRQVDDGVRKAKFKIGWVPHVAAVTQSVDPGYFAQKGAGKLVRGIMRTMAGSRLVFGISRVRRKLRVHEK